MKKLFVSAALATGLLCLVPAAGRDADSPVRCTRKLPDRDVLLPVERLLWMPEEFYSVRKNSIL
ncbi:hypothetical protein [Paraflavitalea sp. CAU 1676]|uniref:hypothetical protein n=1 Tax=Paraflavitalea sp. CAU 1676 TaxID=3032598 RepID=UPI0023DBFA77|nr:hypothetical protein [Paraflavitalea sp. CAU 1676]MDF2188917.1 hypothetical protein [Paraflavitalea sp. CAU 1676]